MADILMAKAFLEFLFRRPVSISRPTINIKMIKPTLAITLKVFIELSGKIAFVKPGTLPKTEGPNRIPVITSAITAGSSKKY
jgi:hypothetical protein